MAGSLLTSTSPYNSANRRRRQSSYVPTRAAFSATNQVQAVDPRLQVPSPSAHSAQPVGSPSTLAAQALAAAPVG